VRGEGERGRVDRRRGIGRIGEQKRWGGEGERGGIQYSWAPFRSWINSDTRSCTKST